MGGESGQRRFSQKPKFVLFFFKPSLRVIIGLIVITKLVVMFNIYHPFHDTTELSRTCTSILWIEISQLILLHKMKEKFCKIEIKENQASDKS